MPDATLCGVASAQASVLVFFPDGTCAGNTNVLTYTAPQVAGAGVAGFQPQNLAYEGQTPFTFVATAGNNDFSNLVGQTVQVEFSVAAGTPFRGGTSSFDVVPGTVASVTTVTGSAPTIVAAGNTLPNVSVRVRFEDGTCTDLADTSYFRADNVLAISGTGGLTLIATSAANPYAAGANTIVGGTPIAGAAAPPGGVVVAPELNRAFGVAGTNLVVVDLAGPAATSAAGAPTLGAASIVATVPLGGAGAAAAYDPVTARVFVVVGNSVVSVDARTLTVISTVAIPAPALAGTVVLDSANRTLLMGAGTVIKRFDVDTLQNDTQSPLIAAVGTAVWTGGFAIHPNGGRVVLTYDDPNPVLADFVQALDAVDLTTVQWTTVLAANSNPTAVVGVDSTSNTVWWGQAAPANNLQSAGLAGGGLGAASAVPGASAIVGPGSTANTTYITSAANNAVTVLTSGTGVVVAGPIVVAGAAALYTTSP